MKGFRIKTYDFSGNNVIDQSDPYADYTLPPNILAAVTTFNLDATKYTPFPIENVYMKYTILEIGKDPNNNKV